MVSSIMIKQEIGDCEPGDGVMERCIVHQGGSHRCCCHPRQDLGSEWTT